MRGGSPGREREEQGGRRQSFRIVGFRKIAAAREEEGVRCSC
jgi:hypothetical protein